LKKPSDPVRFVLAFKGDAASRKLARHHGELLNLREVATPFSTFQIPELPIHQCRDVSARPWPVP